MISLIFRRIGLMLMTMVTLSFIVFLILELDPDGVARKALGQFSTPEQRLIWLAQGGYYRTEPLAEAESSRDGQSLYYQLNEDTALLFEPPADGQAVPERVAISDMDGEQLQLLRALEPERVSSVRRYFDWLTRFAQGDFGYSFRFKVEVSEVLWPRLANTGILAGLAMLVMIPLSLALGVLAGMDEGSKRDRSLSVVAIVSTSVPEFASAVLLVAIFVFYLEWLPGTSTMIAGFDFSQIVLPVAVLVIYGTGYIARITRASMAEVMNAPYVRTALLKGLPYHKVIFKHALRNALITPVTAIMLQFPWLLSGVIVVEYFFAYKGFGSLLWEAASFDDIYLIEACVVITVVVVVSTQLIADMLYVYLNPRIRFK